MIKKLLFYTLIIFLVFLQPAFAYDIVFKMGFEDDIAFDARVDHRIDFSDCGGSTCLNNTVNCDGGCNDAVTGFNDYDILGRDRATATIERAHFQLVTTGDYYTVELSTEQVSSGSKALKIETDVGAGSGRVQLEIVDTAAGETYDNFDMYCIKFDHFIEDTMPEQITDWWMINEARSNGEGTYKFFIIDMDGTPYWRLHIDNGDTKNWENQVVEVPFGRWYTMIIFFKYGDADNGKFIVKIEDNEVEYTVFDKSEDTRSNTGTHIYKLMPIKHYGTKGFPAFIDNLTMYSVTGAADIPDFSSDKATNINPPDEGTGVALDAVITWTNPGADTITNDVYFDAGACPGSTKVVTATEQESYDPGTLAVATTYCTRVDVNHLFHTETGDWIEFSTGPGPPIVAGESLSGIVNNAAGPQIAINAAGPDIVNSP